MEEKELFATEFDELVAHNNPQDELESCERELNWYKSRCKQLIKENTDLKNLKVCNSCGDWNDDVHACQMYVRQDELYEIAHENEKLKQLLKQFVDKYTEVMFFGDENLFAEANRIILGY